MTEESLKELIEKHFSSIPDKRVVTRSSHKLVDIIAIAILGILWVASGWVGIETYGKAKQQKLNEITAIPLLLEQLKLKSRIITIDPMGTQTAIAQQIQDSGADYIVTLKANYY